MPRNGPWLRTLIVLFVIALTIHVGRELWYLALRFGDIIVLFLSAWLFSLVLRPAAFNLRAASRLPWALSVAIVYLLFFGLVVLLSLMAGPMLLNQMAELVNEIPRWIQTLPELYLAAQQNLPEFLRPEQLPTIFNERDLINSLQQLAPPLAQNALGLLTGVSWLLFSLIIVLILSFYLTLDGTRIARGTLSILPDEHVETATYLVDSFEKSFGGFLRGQLIQSIIYAVGTAVILKIAGVGYVTLATTIAAIAMFIPLIGPFIALGPALFFAALEGSVTTVVVVLLALLALQQVVFNIVAPKVMSDVVGIHPLLVFLAILVGSKVAGIGGAILGVPVTAVIVAMIGFFYRRGLPNSDELLSGVMVDEPEQESERYSLPGNLINRLLRALASLFQAK